jgi:hypothetical protein
MRLRVPKGIAEPITHQFFGLFAKSWQKPGFRGVVLD